MIDFTKLPTKKKSYGGKDGPKFSVERNGELWMLKLARPVKTSAGAFRGTSPLSEYLGCRIFSMLGEDAQETLLGTYSHREETFLAVACKDFEGNGYRFLDFASVLNGMIDASKDKPMELANVLRAIRIQALVHKETLSHRFWNMFVIDAFLANPSRSHKDWGFLYNQKTDEARIAPIFDCGSCLFPQNDEAAAEEILSDPARIRARIYDFPTSSLQENGKRINYYSFLRSHKYPECDRALKRIKERVDLSKIDALIDDVECLGGSYKRFLKTILRKRFEAYFLCDTLR